MRSPAFLRLPAARAAVVLAAIFLASCGKNNEPAPAPPTQRSFKVAIAGIEPYRQAMAAQDTEEAMRLLQEAVHANPQLAEAWFAMGRIQIQLAPDIVKTDEQKGVMVFREGLDAEREALALLNAGKVSVWTAAEEEQARMTLAVDLADVDQITTNSETLGAALRLRAR